MTRWLPLIFIGHFLCIAVCLAYFIAMRDPVSLICLVGNLAYLGLSVRCVLDVRRSKRRLAELKSRIAAP